MSSEGNWKGRETGTRPPSIPKPRGRGEVIELKRLLPDAVDPWRRRELHKFSMIELLIKKAGVL